MSLVLETSLVLCLQLLLDIVADSHLRNDGLHQALGVLPFVDVSVGVADSFLGFQSSFEALAQFGNKRDQLQARIEFRGAVLLVQRNNAQKATVLLSGRRIARMRIEGSDHGARIAEMMALRRELQSKLFEAFLEDLVCL